MPPDAILASSSAEAGAERVVSPALEGLWRRGTEFLGTRYAVMGGAMSWVSERRLVSTISNAGGFGVIACGSMPPALLEAEIAATQALTDRPFGVNLITMHPALDDLIAVCLRAKVGHIVLAGGVPGGSAVRAVKDGGREADLLRTGPWCWRAAWCGPARMRWSSKAPKRAVISGRCR